jgi:hypothetical protein
MPLNSRQTETRRQRRNAEDASPHASPTGSLTRVVATTVTATVCAYFVANALTALTDPSAATLKVSTKTLLAAAMIIPATCLIGGVAARRIDVPFCIYWAWNFVFLGMAPTYQVANQSFPWKAHLAEETIISSLRLVLLGHAAFFVAYIYCRGRELHQRTPGGNTRTPGSVNRLLARISVLYCVVALMFIALMGGSLYNARSAFRDQVLAISQLPLGGTLYFVVTAGAIAVPSALIAARRAGSQLSLLTVAAPFVLAAVVTNPLLGSRFLTGSFLVSVSIAAFYGRPILRMIPVASIVLLTVLFPTLDVLRGDSSSSEGVKALDPSTSVQTYDFDAFEMLAREVTVADTARSSVPSSVHMALAPVLRWVPVAARPFIGDSGGAVVAETTGMQYTNVSMPLQGEGHLIAGTLGAALLMGGLGAWVGVSSTSRRGRGDAIGASSITNTQFATRVCAPATGALLFIVLRGSLYEVLAYLLLVLALYMTLRHKGKE